MPGIAYPVTPHYPPSAAWRVHRRAGLENKNPPFALVTNGAKYPLRACMRRRCRQAGARGFPPCASGHRSLCWSRRIRTCCARTCDTIVSYASSISFIVVGKKRAAPAFGRHLRQPEALIGPRAAGLILQEPDCVDHHVGGANQRHGIAEADGAPRITAVGEDHQDLAPGDVRGAVEIHAERVGIAESSGLRERIRSTSRGKSCWPNLVTRTSVSKSTRVMSRA